jgi:hypothetical protein
VSAPDRAPERAPERASEPRTVTGTGAATDRRLPTWALLVGAYALTRLAVLAATAVVDTLEVGGARCGDAVPRPIEGMAALARCWDTRWFVATATEGWPAALPADGEQTTLAFFPGYPALVAAVHALGVPAVGAAIAVSLALGALATLGVHRLARCVTDDERVAVAAGLLFCCFPGAVVLSWGYSEALAATLVAGCLVALHRRAWAVAGLVAAAGSATRLDVGHGLTVATAAAAVLAWRHGERRAVVAPLLAPLGAVAFWAFLWARTGSPRAWTVAQDRGWDQHMDFGTHAVNTIGRVVTHPFRSPTSVIQLLTILTLAAGLVTLAWWARRAPRETAVPWVAYTVVMLVVMLASNQVGFRPRAVLLLLPVFVAAAVRLPRPAAAATAAGFAVVQALLVVLYLGTSLIFPP